MIVTSSPQALPGSCFKCGSANRESFVDLEFNMDYHGAVILCDLCIIEMAQLLGMLSKEQAVELTAENETLKSLAFEQQVTIDGQEKAISGLTTARRYPAPVPVDSSGDTPASDESAERELRERETDLESEGSGSSEPDTVEQLGGVRPAESNGADFKLGI